MTPLTFVFAALGAWVLVSVVVSLLIGQAIGLRDRADRPPVEVRPVVRSPETVARRRIARAHAKDLVDLGGGRVSEG